MPPLHINQEICSCAAHEVAANWILVIGVLPDRIDLAAAIPTIYLALRYLSTMPSMSILLDRISARSLTQARSATSPPFHRGRRLPVQY